MSNRAKVTSVEAIEAFRNSLILYLSKAKPTLEEINSDVARTRMWIENEQRLRWEHELRRRKKNLDESQNAFFSAQMSQLREPTVAERLAVTKAKNAFEEGEAKLRIIKRWNREMSSQVEPLARQLEHLHTMLSSDLPKAIAYLSNMVKTLQDYASVSGTASDDPAATQTPALEPGQKETNEPQ